jgi:CO/xanthine dehydrogenase FAD-binding subunit
MRTSMQREKMATCEFKSAARSWALFCNVSPAADGIPALLALDAQVETQSNTCGAVLMPLAEFVHGAGLRCAGQRGADSQNRPIVALDISKDRRAHTLADLQVYGRGKHRR